jgi:hypothetical protein
MLRCDNTAFCRAWRAKLGKSPILAAMDETEELARRFLALWGEYLAALAAEPASLDMLRRWLTVGEAAARPAAGAQAVAGTSGERDLAVAELARRVGELERRVAALEPGKPGRRPAARPRSGTRSAVPGKP